MLASLPPDPPAVTTPLALRAEALVASGHADRAVALLKGREADPVLGLRLGRAYLRLGRYEAATIVYEGLLRRHHTLAPAFYGLAWSWLVREQYGLALGPLAEAVRLDPRHAVAWRELARCYYHMRRYERALASSVHALEMAPGDAEAWRLEGLAAMALGRREKALAALGRASALAPKDALSRRFVGRLELEAGRPDQALGPLREAWALGDDQARALLYEAYWAKRDLGGLAGLLLKGSHGAP